jgi:hypothetical protein
MGTSASNGGPKGSPRLLPDWYNDPPTPPPPPIPPPGDDDPEREPTPDAPPNDKQPTDRPAIEALPNAATTNWGTAKGALTRYSNGTSGSSERKAGNRYVSSLGGSRSATKAASQGIRVGSNYAGFLGSVTSQGINATLTSFGLSEFIGRPTDEVCAAIANSLAPIGATNDEAIARDALIETLDTLYTKILDAGGNLDNLNSLSPDMVKETLIEYVGNFVFTKWMYELGIAIEKGNISEDDAVSLERAMKEFIKVETQESYRDIAINQLNLNNQNNLDIVTEIFETAYSILES